MHLANFSLALSCFVRNSRARRSGSDFISLRSMLRRSRILGLPRNARNWILGHLDQHRAVPRYFFLFFFSIKWKKFFFLPKKAEVSRRRVIFYIFLIDLVLFQKIHFLDFLLYFSHRFIIVSRAIIYSLLRRNNRFCHVTS